MLIDTLNESIIDMKTVHELETASADTKKQVTADYNFKQLISSLQQMVNELKLAVDNFEFNPSANVLSGFKSFFTSCDKIVQAGAANNVTTQYVTSESKKLYAVMGQEWNEYYTKSTSNILGLIEAVKGILPDETKASYATNKIKKAATWNKSIENLNYLKQGLEEAKQILTEINLDENSSILAFLKLVSEGNATIADLTDEILEWIKKENLSSKIGIRFI